MDLKRLGHAALIVEDLDKCKDFYTELLGFRIVEEDPEHGGTFMGLRGSQAHEFDLIPAHSEELMSSIAGGSRGPVHHMAFVVDSFEAVEDAYNELLDAGVEILNKSEHESQVSIYFRDPEGNILEIYWERPGAAEMMAAGRGDQNVTLELQRRPRTNG